MGGIEQCPVGDVEEDREQEEDQRDDQVEGTPVVDIAMVIKKEVEVKIVASPTRVHIQSPTVQVPFQTPPFIKTAPESSPNH